MKKLDVSRTINTLANLGVIAGIVFLILEIRQLQQQMEAQTSFNYYSSLRSDLAQVAASPYLGGIVAKLFSGVELSEEERASAEAFRSNILNQWEYGWREMEAGRFDSSQFNIAEKTNTFQSFPGLRAQWEQQSSSMNPNFVEFMQDNVIGP